MTYPLYRSLFVAFVTLVIGCGVYWTARRPSRPTSRLGMRGLKRQQSLLRPLWGSVEPFVRWMGVRVGPLLGTSLRAQLDLQLTYAGDYLGLSAEEYFGCTVTTALLGALLGAVASFVAGAPFPELVVLLFVLLGGAIPYVVVDTARANRLKAIGRGLPYAIDLMALSMSAGLDFPGSIHQVVEKAKANEALREELGYLLQQLQLGRTRSQALGELAARTPIESAREFVQAILQAEERGNPVAAVLEVQASTARTRRSNLADKLASDMRAKMILPTMMIVGVGLTLIAAPSTMMVDKFMGGGLGGASATGGSQR